MIDERGKLTSVAWEELFPWLNLGRALRLAINLRALVFAAVALIGTVAGWRICGAVCDRLLLPAAEERSSELMTPSQLRLAAAIQSLSVWPWEQPPPPPFLIGDSQHVSPVGSWWVDNPIRWAHHWLSAPFVGMFNPQVSLSEFVFLLLCALWELVVWAFCGGAITRLAAIGLARQEQLSWNYLTQFARSKWSAYFTAPLFPLIGVLLAAVPLALFGLLLRLQIGLLLAGALWFLVLLGGFFMAILLVGLFFGWPLMWATISSEGTDSFDALSRSYAYTYQRPLHYFFYAVLAALLGLLGWIFVSIFTATVVDLGNWAVSWLGGDLLTVSDSDLEAGALSVTGLKLIRFWVDIAITLQTAFVFSYFWTATTAVYFLLRRTVDATEMDEVFVPDEQTPYGLPPLKHDEAGVVGVADEPPPATDAGAAPA